MERKLFSSILSIVVLILFSQQVISAGKIVVNKSTESVKTIKRFEGHKAVKEKDKVKILDTEGEVIKELSLRPETKIEEIEISQGPKVAPKRLKVKKEITKNAVISKNGRYIGIGSNEYDIAVIDEKGKEESLYGEGRGTGEFALLDIEGKVLWEKRFPEGRIGSFISPEPLISDDGEVVVIKTRDTTGVSSTPKGVYVRDIIYVYDKNGKEILSLSKRDDKNLSIGSPEKVSPNGRYLAISITKLEKPPYETIMRFYHLKKNNFWDSSQRYVIYEISNSGVAKVDNPWNPEDKTKTIDLKEYLGE